MDFEQVYNTYWYYLLSGAIRLVPQQVGEDLVVDVFIAYWNNRHKVPVSNIKGFLSTVLKRKIQDYRKEKKCHQRHNLLYAMEQEVFEEADFIKAQVISRLLDEAIKGLPKQPKRVIQLTLAGYSPQEISRMAAKNEQTIYNQKQFAIKFIRNYMLPRLQ